MFKTLKSGLAALTILTAGAGAAFATTPSDIVDDCTTGLIFLKSHCTIAVLNCITAPFGANCASELGTAHSVAKSRYCQERAGTDEPLCTDTWGNPNAANWVNSPDTTVASTPDTAQRNQFVQGTAGWINSGRIAITAYGYLYSGTTQFKDVDLGGANSDGVAFFQGGNHFYAAILSGTDLGGHLATPAPDSAQTASWIGKIKTLGSHAIEEDFVLEVDFQNTHIAAFVQDGQSSYHYYLDGNFNDSGVISGTVDARNFTDNKRNDLAKRSNGVLTGLIGKKRAVGVFHSNATGTAGYVGGFIAAEPNAGYTFLTTTCAADPFHKYCFLEKGLQADKIVDCTVGNNVNTADCERAKVLHPCIKTPFDPNCKGAFGDSYDTVKANRAAFCLGDLDDPLCTTGIAKTGICTYAPFTSICFDKTDAGYAGYKTERGNILADCRTTPDSPRCHDVTDNPNAVTWEGSFAPELTDVPIIPTDGTRRDGHFLKNLEDKSAGNIDPGDTVGDIVVKTAYSARSGSLNLNTAEFNGEPLGGDVADGMAFFRGQVNGQGTYSSNYSYAGIFSGTDLGAPLGSLAPDGKTTASWVGRFQSVGTTTNTDFVLEIDYARQSVDAFIGTSYGLHYYLDGNYDDKGVITGVFNLSNFFNKNRKTKNYTYNTSVVTGLIGSEGAVGAFYSNNTSWSSSYAGGFVARPPKNAEDNNEVAFLDDICTNNPFHSYCYLEVTKRDDLIKTCITDGNANTDKCKTAREYDPCITNPFYAECPSVSPVNYTMARTNRLAFCNDLANKDSPVCTGERIAELCTHDPFNQICFNGNHYNRLREAACGTSGTFTDEQSEQCAVAKTRVCDTNGDIFNPLCSDIDAIKRTNRLTICDDSTNATHADCTGLAIVGLCTYKNPFHKVCMDKEIYHGARIDFSTRVDFCDTLEDEAQQICTGIKSRVTSLDWVDGFATKPVRVLATINSQFLQATATGLDFGTIRDWHGHIPVVTNLNLKDATFDGRVLNEGVADGVAFSRIRTGRYSYKYYVGILSGTDLGAPLTQEYGKVYWNGQFQITDYPFINTDFALEIDFAARKITTFVHSYQNYYFHLKGGFDDNGVIIDGTVDYGRFMNHDIETPTGSRSAGTLTGLIGQDGAVGVFYSSRYNNSYAGGFVASPNVGKASYFHWLKSFGNTPPSAVPDTSPKNQFLQGTESGLNVSNSREIFQSTPTVTTLSLANARYDFTNLDGDESDGVAFFKGRTHDRISHYYAGVLSETDLGAPIRKTTGTGKWKGEIKTITQGINGDFTLEIDFEDRRIEGFVAKQGRNLNSEYLYLTGDFNDNGVIINGKANYGVFTNGERTMPRNERSANGELTGLIGEEGAVGAYYSRATGGNGYAGGFAVVPTDLSNVTYTDWLDSFTYNPLSREPSITHRRNQFLKTTEIGLNTGVIRRYRPPDSRNDAPIVNNLNLATATYNNVALGGDKSDGVAFFNGYFEGSDAHYYYAGILSGTDLGAPVNQATGTADWNGRIQATDMPAKDFTLEINFAEKTVEAFVKKYSHSYGYYSRQHYHLQGDFDDNGVIRGTVDYGAFDPNKLESRLATGNRIPGIMRGLIGQDGAVGVFISDGFGYSSAHYSGGFVACPLHADGRCQSATR